MKKKTSKKKEEFAVSVISNGDTFYIDAPEWMGSEVIHIILKEACEVMKEEMINDKLAADIEKTIKEDIKRNKKAAKLGKK